MEYKIHSHLNDKLSENHKLAYTQINCDICDATIHAYNNECMQSWFETNRGNFCTKCFKIPEVIENIEDCIIKERINPNSRYIKIKEKFDKKRERCNKKRTKR
jgi:hypothetical protein